MVENALYYGDNLEILRKYIPDETIDLIYLDPPFNSNATYNVLFKEPSGELSTAQLQAFSDTWHWDLSAEATFKQVVEGPLPQVARMLSALREFIGSNDMMAYLTMMTPRLVELHRVLKPTGSLYLHCDPTASHYLKIVMDTIFGAANCVNEIIWHYRKWPSGRYTFQRNHDVILFYSRSGVRERIFNQLYMDRAPSTLRRFGNARIVSGYDEGGHRVPSQMADDESVGVRMDDVWEIGRVPPIKQLFPTEKPTALLERIIEASSKAGDTVLDPFCGCGTSILAATKLNRQWIGIDITHLAISLIKHRLADSFGLKPDTDYAVIGEPKDMTGAQALAEQDRYQFQWWALSLVGASPVGDERKKGADRGIDGLMTFVEAGGKAKIIIVSVKSGHVNAAQIRDLRGAMERERADLGLFVTLEPSTGPMRAEAAAAGLYQSELWRADFPRIRICTVEELLEGRQPALPRSATGAFQQAPRARPKPEQVPLI